MMVFFQQLLLQDRVRGIQDSDGHVALNQRGEALFERPEHFKSVLTAMLRRAIANLSDSDADIAHRLSDLQGEYDASSMFTPVIQGCKITFTSLLYNKYNSLHISSIYRLRYGTGN